MKHRIIIFIVLVFLIALIPISKWLGIPEKISWCYSNFICESFWIRGVYWPLKESLIYLISALTVLIFFPISFLRIWLKIMVPYLVVAFLIIITTPELCGGMICFDRTLMATGLSKLFLISTVVILLFRSIYLLIISKRKPKEV